jgi:hypothetical protein
LNRERTPPPTTSLADHLGQLEGRNWSRAARNFVVSNFDELNGGAEVTVAKVAPLRLSGPIVKIAPGKKRGVAITMLSNPHVVWFETASADWYDAATQQARVRVGDEIVVDATVKRVRDARGGGKFLVVTTPKLVRGGR